MSVEEILSRELREVADGLSVPAMPHVPEVSPRAHRRWQPLLVAASVVLIVVGAVAVVASSYRGSEGPDPAPSPTDTVRRLTAEPPTVPYIVAERLYVDGEQVPGAWWEVQQAGETWLAQRDDNTWWWGTAGERHAIPGEVSLLPHLSPDGTLLAVASTQDAGLVRLIDTRSGETIGTLPIDMSDPRDALGVIAVTDDAQVFLAGDTEQLMWVPAESDETIDLGITAPDQFVSSGTPAGLVVLDGNKDGESDMTYLADVSDSGLLTRVETLPSDAVVVDPSGTWLAYGGSWGGESKTIPSIQARSIDGEQKLTLEPPDDRPMLASSWEDDDLLLAELGTEESDFGLARCSIREGRCLVIDTH